MIREPIAHNWSSLLMNPHLPYARNKLLHALLAAYAFFWVGSTFSPTDRTQWFLESLLPFATILVLAVTYRKFRFTNLSYLLMFLFLCLHTYAAHYAYQNTPIDQWLKSTYHLKRSYFDRLVHLAFGLLLTYPFRELLIRASSLRGYWTFVVPAVVSAGLGAAFEIGEMFVAMIGGNAGADYLGLQGDIYDTQKDMALGLIGAALSMGGLAWWFAGYQKNRN